MTVVLQKSYSPQQRPALIGMVCDMTEAAIATWVNETAAGIPFGMAVGQGTIIDAFGRGRGCVLGGTSFLGISVRDDTLSLSPVDPYSSTLNPLDAYGLRTNVGVLTRGRIWVGAGASVNAGDPLFYGATGVFANSASGTAATGWVQFSKQPNAGDTLVINAATLTFVASGATGDQVNIGPTLGDTVAAAAAVLEGSATAGFAALHFNAYPPSPGGSAQGSGADTIMISAVAPGTAGNALAITTIPAGATKSAGTLLGGTAAATAVTGGRWLDTVNAAGGIARVSLALQI
jgi:hypothetical protein